MRNFLSIFILCVVTSTAFVVLLAGMVAALNLAEDVLGLAGLLVVAVMVFSALVAFIFSVENTLD